MTEGDDADSNVRKGEAPVAAPVGADSGNGVEGGGGDSMAGLFSDTDGDEGAGDPAVATAQIADDDGGEGGAGRTPESQLYMYITLGLVDGGRGPRLFPVSICVAVLGLVLRCVEKPC